MHLKASLADFSLHAWRTAFARARYRRLNQLMVRLGMSGLGILNYESASISGEDNFLRSFARSCPPNAVVFDVGANVGAYTRRVLHYVPSARIWAFEPHPVTFRTLAASALELGFEAVQAGCGRETTRRSIYDYASQDGSSHASLYSGVLKRLHRAPQVVSHEVDIMSLDSFLAERSIERVHLLKIDTEGHEFDVLTGAKLALRQRRVDAIHFEFNEMNVESRVFFRDIVDFLPQYSFWRMLPTGLLPMREYTPLFWEIFAYQNVLAKLST